MDKKIFIYRKPNAMIGHRYTDDVAIIMTNNKREALTKFKQYYDCNIKDIEEIRINDGEVSILTDY